MTTLPIRLRHIHVDTELVDQTAELIPAPANGPWCDVRLDRSPFLCTREAGHEDETHVAHDGAGRAYAVWPLAGFALLRSAGVG